MFNKAFVRLEDIDPNTCEWLINHGSLNPAVQHFTDFYLRFLRYHRKEWYVEIFKIGFAPEHVLPACLGVKPPASKFVPDPFPLLNRLLYHVMKTGQTDVMVDSRIVVGFSGCGRGFYDTFSWSFKKGELLSPNIQWPERLVETTADGTYWKGGIPWRRKTQLYHFLFFLRATIAHLAQEPIGKKSALSLTEIAHQMTQLPRRTALSRTGDQTMLIRTYDTPDALQGPALAERWAIIQAQTRQRYCRPRLEIEKAAMPNTEPPQAPPAWEEIQQW